MAELDKAQCKFKVGSAVDPVGRLFEWRGRLFRGITAEYENSVRQTVLQAHSNKWFENGLIHTEITDHSLPEYPLVIEHAMIQFQTIRGEWSAEGLRSAALCYLGLSSALAQHGLCLKDAHPWNILFDNTTPYFVDWGSIGRIGEVNWAHWFKQFRKFVLFPLFLFSLGQYTVARALVREHATGVGDVLLDYTASFPLPEAPLRIFSSANGVASLRMFGEMRDYVESLRFPRVSGKWTDYKQPRFNSVDEIDTLRGKDRILFQLLQDDDAASVLDIGCNYGLHSQISAALGKKVLSLDIDETCLNDLYLISQRHGREVLPLYLDFAWPIGDSGFMNTIPSAQKRLSCDTILFMAIMHHLVFKYNVCFDAVAYSLNAFGPRRVIAEFVPSDDIHVSQWNPEKLPWYTLDNFIKAMNQYFSSYTVFDSDPLPRKIIVFENRRHACR